MNFNKLFATLAKEGFTIEEFNSSYSDDNNYVAIYYNNDKTMAVIVSNEDNYHLKAIDAYNYLKMKGIKEVYINNIIEVKDGIIEDKDFYGIITVDSNTGNLIKARRANEWIVNVLKQLNNPQKLKKKITKQDILTVTNALIIMNIIIFIISAILSESLMDIDPYVLIFLGAKFNVLIDRGEVYRLLTCIFLHGGLIHIGFNMYALKSIGDLTEKIYGKTKFLLIYILSGIIGSYCSYKFSSNTAVGASGAIFGLLGSALVFAYYEKERIGKDFFTEILKVIVINIFIGLSLSNIDNYAHLGGLLSGIVVSFIIYGNIKRKDIN